MTTIEFLKIFLSDTYALALKTHAFHWNVKGQNFRDLHIMFDNQYKELSAVADVIAERIRALGEFAPGGVKTYAQMSSINDPEQDLDAEEMLDALITDHENLAEQAKRGLAIAAQGGDDATADILITRIQEHEKQLWIMRSILGRAVHKIAGVEKAKRPARRSA